MDFLKSSSTKFRGIIVYEEPEVEKPQRNHRVTSSPYATSEPADTMEAKDFQEKLTNLKVIGCQV